MENFQSSFEQETGSTFAHCETEEALNCGDHCRNVECKTPGVILVTDFTIQLSHYSPSESFGNVSAINRSLI